MTINEFAQAFDEIDQKRSALQAELDNLDGQEKATKEHMRPHAVAKAQALIERFGIARDEVKFTAKRTLVPRFVNGETGVTWHGVGKRPAWLVGKNVEDYRIKPLHDEKVTK